MINLNRILTVWKKIGYCIRLVILPNWSVIFSGQLTEDTIPDMEFGTKQYAYFVSV